MPKVDRYKNKKLKNSIISAGVWVEHADKANVATIGSGIYIINRNLPKNSHSL